MPTYKTPDVYVEEISLFPPSVAEVETAVPAFIGYTERAAKYADGDLILKPTRIKSLLDYEELYGEAPPMKVTSLNLDENNLLAGQKMETSFYMYDAIRLFFKNGGGKCYIISVGLFKDHVSVDKAAIKKGLDALKKMDEPTLILFPDAVLLQSDELYSLQQDALKQCADLMDRFAIFDLLEKRNDDANFGVEEGPEDFRDGIGINHLKYGSAYTPWLKTNLGVEIHYRDVKEKIFRSGVHMPVDQLTNDVAVKALVGKLDNAVDDAVKITNAIEALQTNAFPSLKAKYANLRDAFKAAPTVGAFEDLFEFIYDMAMMADSWGAGTVAVAGTELKADITAMISGALKSSLSKLIAYDRAAATALSLPGNFTLYDNESPAHAGWGAIFAASAPATNASVFGTGTTDEARMLTAEDDVSAVFAEVETAVAYLAKTALNYEATYEGSLGEQHPVYRNMIKQLASAVTIVPPSGAVAGIYAMIDSTRGVWKAPANVSLSGVVGVTRVIDFEDQKDLNVDVTAGKSINAIRPFTGKGTLIWGARTLAGNDNEWRYIPVRRFFNMVEESIKKSTYWAVFEPNDANTWIKVKGMIENFLILKWRDGALQGAKPSDAFFVKIGLGVTMTPIDILEGRMIVEIGMAVVRPAEFIILKFSHKMAVA